MRVEVDRDGEGGVVSNAERPCTLCGGTPRYTTTSYCKPCALDYQRFYYSVRSLPEPERWAALDGWRAERREQRGIPEPAAEVQRLAGQARLAKAPARLAETAAAREMGWEAIEDMAEYARCAADCGELEMDSARAILAACAKHFRARGDDKGESRCLDLADAIEAEPAA